MSDDDALLYGAPVHVLGGEDEPMAYYARFWRESRDPDRVWLVAYTPSGSPYPVLALRERVAVECDGGTYSGGRHTRGDGYRRDAEKLNAAAALGWRVFRVTADMLRDDPHGVVDMVRAAVERREGDGRF